MVSIYSIPGSIPGLIQLPFPLYPPNRPSPPPPSLPPSIPEGKKADMKVWFLKVVSLRVHHICLPSYLSITIPGEYIELSQEGIMELDMEDLRVCPSVGLCT